VVSFWQRARLSKRYRSALSGAAERQKVGRRGEEANMEIVAPGLIGVSRLLLHTWFGTRRTMLREGAWALRGATSPDA
jgi:hypothetical protein